MFSTTASRRIAPVVTLIVLIAAIWLVRSEEAGAGVPAADGIDLVYVAVASNFPDSLGVGPGAGVNAAPILLVPTNPPIPGATAAELQRLDPKKVVIVGGNAVVSQAMQDAIELVLPFATVERIGGADRYETNTLFTQSVYPVEGWASVAAPAFTSFDDTRGFSIGTSGSYDTSGGAMYASIQLPHGATILELKAIGSDTSGSNFTVTLGRASVYSSEQIASTASSGSSGDVEFSTTSVSPGRETVDNGTWAYWISASPLDSNRSIGGVMVRYRLGTPGS